jgi:hypothetical protein
MINLLSLKNKKGLQQEYYFRLVFVVLQMLIGVFLVGVVLLAPSYVLTRQQTAARQWEVLDIRNNPEFQERGELLAALRSLRQQLGLFSVTEPHKVSEAFFDPLLMAGDAEGLHIHFYEILFEQDDDDTNKATVQAFGFAENRGHLLRFLDIVQADPRFVDATVPVGDLAQNNDVSFRLTLEVEDTHLEDL